MEELERARRGAGRALADGDEAGGCVWPEQAEMYQRNPSGVTRRVREAFERAGFGDAQVHAEREDGKRRASVRDFHSLRTTWITAALSRGVPMETVKLISGHKTVEVVTTHYFRPGQEQVRAALAGALPDAITGANAEKATRLLGGSQGYEIAAGPGEALAKALEALRGVTGKANLARVEKAVAWIEKAKRWVDTCVVREKDVGAA